MPAKQAANEKLPRPEWPPPELVAKFASLPPDTQTVAIALATFGSPFHYSEIRHVLNETGARDVAGRSFSAIRAREGLKKLVSAGWVEVQSLRTKKGGSRCTAAVATILETADSLSNGNCKPGCQYWDLEGQMWAIIPVCKNADMFWDLVCQFWQPPPQVASPAQPQFCS